MDYETYPCDSCGRECDGWDASFCCAYCHWLNGDEELPCSECDSMDI